MKLKKRLIAFIVGFTLLLQGSVFAAQDNFTKEEILEELSEVIDFLSENYIGDRVSLKDIRDGLLHGLTTPYDPYTQFLNEEEYKDFFEDVNSAFVGVGITLSETSTDKGATIVSIIEGTPAEEVGLKAGDKIISINGIDFTERPFEDFINTLRGKEGTTVFVTVLRDEKEIDFEVQRKKVVVPSVVVKKIEDLEIDLNKKISNEIHQKIRYVSVTTFGDITANEFKAAYDKMKKEGVQTLILDLRNNTGGYISACVDIARTIVPKGTILSQKSIDPFYTSRSLSALEASPFEIIVLINQYTASSAEILASALQDSGSILVGEKTYGKGVGQQTVGLPLGGSLKVTTIEWFTRNGNSIEGKGITPNIQIEENLELDKILIRGYDEALRTMGQL